MRLGHEKVIRALDQEFISFKFNFHQSQHQIHSLESSLQTLPRDHVALINQFIKPKTPIS